MHHLGTDKIYPKQRKIYGLGQICLRLKVSRQRPWLAQSNFHFYESIQLNFFRIDFKFGNFSKTKDPRKIIKNWKTRKMYIQNPKLWIHNSIIISKEPSSRYSNRSSFIRLMQFQYYFAIQTSIQIQHKTDKALIKPFNKISIWSKFVSIHPKTNLLNNIEYLLRATQTTDDSIKKTN